MKNLFRFRNVTANAIYAGANSNTDKGRHAVDDGSRKKIAEVLYGVAAMTAALFLLATTL